MPLAISVAEAIPDEIDAVAFGVFSGLVVPGGRALDARVATSQGFTGAANETMLASDESGRLLIAVGLGQAGDGLKIDGLRRMGAAAASAGLPGRRLIRSRCAYGPERLTKLFHEQLRLLESREVPTAIKLVPVDEVGP